MRKKWESSKVKIRSSGLTDMQSSHAYESYMTAVELSVKGPYYWSEAKNVMRMSLHLIKLSNQIKAFLAFICTLLELPVQMTHSDRLQIVQFTHTNHFLVCTCRCIYLQDVYWLLRITHIGGVWVTHCFLCKPTHLQHWCTSMCQNAPQSNSKNQNTSTTQKQQFYLFHRLELTQHYLTQLVCA